MLQNCMAVVWLRRSGLKHYTVMAFSLCQLLCVLGGCMPQSSRIGFLLVFLGNILGNLYGILSSIFQKKKKNPQTNNPKTLKYHKFNVLDHRISWVGKDTQGSLCRETVCCWTLISVFSLPAHLVEWETKKFGFPVLTGFERWYACPEGERK